MLGACQGRFTPDPAEQQLARLPPEARAEQLVAVAITLPDPDSARAFDLALRSYLVGPGAIWFSDTPPRLVELIRRRARAHRLPPLIAGDAGILGTVATARLPVVPEAFENPAFYRARVDPSLRHVAEDAVPLAYLEPSLSFDNLPVIGRRLRRELGWDGIIAVDLRHIPTNLVAQQGVAAVAMGADLLITHDPALPSAIVAAVRGGDLSQARVDDAARRVIGLKRGRDPIRTVERDDSVRIHAAVEYSSALVAGEPESAGMDPAGLAAATRAIREAMADSVLTSGALAVVRRGNLISLEGFGMTPGGVPVDPARTLFDLASLSKVVGTTTAAGILIDSGALALDDPVARHLPAFAGEGKAVVTIRHLLAHTSGLPSGLWLYGSAESEGEAIAQVLRQPLVRPAGETAEYSDLGMIILAEVIESITEMPLDDFLARELFIPLGMSRTMYLPPARLQDETIPTAVNTERPYPLHGVVHDANAYRLSGVAGHAGLFSTAGDVAVFAQMMLNGGVYSSAEILADSTVDAFTSPQAGTEGRALGWDTPDDRSSAGRFFSQSSFGHTGYTGTSLWIDPERELVVVLLTNRTYPGASAGDILDLRIAVHEAVARSITDEAIAQRPGSR